MAGHRGGIKVTNGFNELNKPSRVIYYADVNGNQTDSIVLPSIPFNAYEGSRPVEIWPTKMRGFVDALHTNGPAPVPGEEILYNHAICDGIYRSSQLKKEVEIEIPAL